MGISIVINKDFLIDLPRTQELKAYLINNSFIKIDLSPEMTIGKVFTLHFIGLCVSKCQVVLIFLCPIRDHGEIDIYLDSFVMASWVD